MVSKKKKLRFCFYCGSLLLDFNDIKNNHCPYSGIKLPFKFKNQKPIIGS
ncbi:MAG: hypothetical protein ACFFHV_14535 [Promethearchaeota archaeon]